MEYIDKHGKEIKEGMFIMLSDGSVERVYKTGDAYGRNDLGINASNEEYMRVHEIPEEYREYYPLSNFNLKEVEIISIPQNKTHTKGRHHERKNHIDR